MTSISKVRKNTGKNKCGDGWEKLVPILGANVITILGTQALLAVGYVLTMLVLS